jgi:uncharacterized membrane protein
MRFLFGRFSRGELRLTRIEAFSDGVFAIIVTLLVLELKVPVLKDHASVSELAHHLQEGLPKFVSWLISFIIVCKFWLTTITFSVWRAMPIMRWCGSILCFCSDSLLFLFPRLSPANIQPTLWP